MTAQVSPVPADASGEIAALIERLRDTEQRLEEITAGEVDSVASSDGRTFLLRRAQERLRKGEGAMQVAILDALPAQVALLDTQGVIIAVNKAWTDFAAINILEGSRGGIGTSYLGVCDDARGPGARDARNVAIGIRLVLEGAEPGFSFAYACHSPYERRWYQMTVTALSDHQRGAVVMHTNVTAQKQADEALRASDLRFRQMAENIHDVFFLNEVGSNKVLYVSPAYETIWDRSCADLYANPLAWMDSIHPDDRVQAQEQSALGAFGKTFEHEFRIVRPDGEIRVIEARGFPVADEQGKTIRIAGVAEDVTERNRLEQSVQASEQHFHFLDDLAQATRGLAETEQIMTAMSRMLGEHLKVSRCAYADVGRDGRRFTILHDYTHGCASTVGEYELSLFGARALRTLTGAQTLVIRDVQTELSPDDGAEMFVAIGIQAVICCPLVKEGRLRAMMAVHQTTPRDWSASEIAVVQEVVERCWSAIERRSAEEKLREGEALLRIAGRTAQLGGWAVNAGDRQVTWSEEVCHILEVLPGTEPDIEQALNFYSLSSRPAITRALEACLQCGAAFDLELEMLTAKGKSIWVRCAGEVRRNHAGAILQARGALQDITEKKRADVVLHKSMEEFRTLAEAMPQIVWIARPDGWNLYFNQHWTGYTGVPAAESRGHAWTTALHPDDRQRARDAWQHATNTAGVYSIECRLRRADGAYRWWLMRGVPFQDDAGTILKWFGTCTDVHDIKMAELAIFDANLALRESERRFSNMLGNVQLASVMLDSAGCITYCNDFFLKLTGWERAEVMGGDWFDLFVPADFAALRDVLATSLVDPPTSWHRENEIATRSGERRLIRWNISVLRSAEGDVIGTASIGEDITESKRAEVSIKHLNRVYSVLSGINTLIVRVRSRDELFREACRIAVEVGGFRMAMVCMVDPDSMLVSPVASSGKSEELMAALRQAMSTPEGAARTRLVRAFKEKRPIVANDWLSDKGSVLHDDYVQAGVRSLVAIPLMVADRAVGVFALYANEADFFHQQEMKLLIELTNDIAFAIDHLQKGDRLSYLAYYDALTGLANRVLFHERLTQGLKHAEQQRENLTLVLVDIERFRTVNDTFGRAAGDSLLKELGARLLANAVDVDGLARIDADQFGIIMSRPGTAAGIARDIDKMSANIFGRPFRIGDSELRISARFGVAIFPNDGADADTLLRNAEAALLNAKSGLERCLFYANSMNERVAEKLELENRLRQAIEKEEFVLHYQPKI
ncbi:MAG TPA: PAS domain S-box protein, partial [Burkholderiales bacterium]|nr:PAS domain S-box protein [Burkholderiales bacterium]